MNATPDPIQPSSYRSKPLWAAIGALSVVVIALAATLVYVKMPPTEPRAIPAVLPAAMDTPAEPAAAASAAVDKTPAAAEKPPAAAAKPAPATATAKPAAKPAKPARAPEPVAAAPAGPVVHSGYPAAAAGGTAADSPPVARPVCLNCGTVTAVTPVEREGAASGAGVVAGGVLGALAGNQVGDGSGRTAATILGAIGGGWAGNTIEKKMKKEIVYQVRVRMDDGSTRMFEQTTLATVGAKVTVEGGALRSADGSLSTPARPAAAPAAATN